MKAEILVKLNPSNEQGCLLQETIKTINSATNYVSEVAWSLKAFTPSALQKALYYEVREKYHLASQPVVKLMARVCEAYSLNSKARYPITFDSHSPVPYDNHILSFDHRFASIWTLDGRIEVPFERNDELNRWLLLQRGLTWLISREFSWFLLTEISVESPYDVEKILSSFC